MEYSFAFSANIVLRKNFTKKDGTSPLVLRIIINSATVDINLNISVLKSYFDSNSQSIFIPKEKKESENINILLQQAKAKASDIFVRYRLMNTLLTTKIFKTAWIHHNPRFDFLQFLATEIKREADIREKGTIGCYNQTVFWLKEFFGNELPFGNLNFVNMDAFHKYQQKKGLAANTIHKHKKTILKFINIAKKQGFFIENPYLQLKISPVKTEIEALNKEELLKLIELEKEPLMPGIKNVLRMFIFSCICGGVRFSDISKFNQDNICDDLLIFTPQKTKRFNRIVKVPIPDFANDFISKNKNRLFEEISNAKANEYLKYIAHFAQIKKNLTTHIARHTFATLFLESGGEQNTLMDIMGISKFDTIRVYIHIASKRKRQNMNQYSQFLQPN